MTCCPVKLDSSQLPEEQIADDHVARVLAGRVTAHCYRLGKVDFDSVARRTNVQTSHRIGLLGFDLFTHSGVARVILEDSVAQGVMHIVEASVAEPTRSPDPIRIDHVRASLLRRAYAALERNEDDRAVALIDAYYRLGEVS